MSVHLLRPARACVLAAVAATLVTPSGVLAKPKDEKKDGEPAVCERDAQGPRSPGLQKNGKTPPGQEKKTPDAKPCDKDDKDEKAAEKAAEQPAPAPVTASAPSQSPQVVVLPPCTSRRLFRITLGRRANVRRARVLLNGRPIPVTRGKRKVTAQIDLRHRVKGTYVVRTVVVTKRLRIRTGTRRYRVCGG